MKNTKWPSFDSYVYMDCSRLQVDYISNRLPSHLSTTFSSLWLFSVVLFFAFHNAKKSNGSFGHRKDNSTCYRSGRQWEQCQMAKTTSKHHLSAGLTKLAKTLTVLVMQGHALLVTRAAGLCH